MEGMSARQLEDIRRKLAEEWRRKSIAGELDDVQERALKNKMEEINQAIKRQLDVERSAAKKLGGKMKLKSGQEFVDDIASKRSALKNMRTAKSFGKKFKSMIPGLGVGLAAMNIFTAPEAQAGEVAADEAEAAVTDLIPGGVDRLGPQEGSLEDIIEDPSKSPEERRDALRRLSERNKQ